MQQVFVRFGLMMSLVMWVMPQALASSVVALPEQKLTQRVDAVVFGRILTTRTVQAPKGPPGTQAMLQIVRGHKGATEGDTLILEVPGGQGRDGLVYSVGGSPVLKPGQMWFGFLLRYGEVYRPWGMAYGLLRVSKKKDGRYWIDRDIKGLGLWDEQGHGAADGILTTQQGASLDALENRVRRYLLPHKTAVTP